MLITPVQRRAERVHVVAVTHSITRAEQGVSPGLVANREHVFSQLKDQPGDYQIEVLCIVADLRSEQGQQRVIGKLQAHFDGIDVLINNAGITEFTEFSQQQPEMIERILRVNVIAPMQPSRRVLPEPVTGMLLPPGFYTPKSISR